MIIRILAAIAVLFTLFNFTSIKAGIQAWTQYKSRFLMPDGRIVDTGNGSVSHTEGQGFAMLMAVANDDKDSFDRIWQWTNNTLKNKANGLFYWRYNPTAPDPITDKNNASDGDVLIAWALLQADERWRDPRYSAASDALTKALLAHTTTGFGGYRVMLPGASGFNLNSSVTLNPSYFIFPAWQAFARRSHLVIWRELIRDGQTLLGKMGWGEANLPTDWVSLSANGQLSPANAWPPRMSYDAVRIPLYLAWANVQSPLLAPWQRWWRQFARDKTPAWVNVATNEPAPYAAQGGLLAVRDLTLGVTVGEPQIVAQDDYYSASLKMLVWLAEQR